MLYYDLEIDKEYVSENYLYKKTQDGLLMKRIQQALMIV